MATFNIGAVSVDTAPFNVDDLDRTASADWASKPVIGAMQPREFMGEGDDEYVLSGQILPTKIGGLSELQLLHESRRAGEVLPVMRGDGEMLGWFAITQIREGHKTVVRSGIGFTVEHEITLIKMSPSQANSSSMRSILGLFGVSGT